MGQVTAVTEAIVPAAPARVLEALADYREAMRINERTMGENGAGGVGGFFEKTFAPLGLRRIHGELLENLAAYVAG